MLTLIADQSPHPHPSDDEGVPILGAGVYQRTLLRALVKYGSCDQYVFLDRNALHSRPRAEHAWLADDLRGRARVASLVELMACPPAGPIVLMTPGATLHGLYGLRRMLSRHDAPCIGTIHSLHGSHLLPSLFGTLYQPQTGIDVLVCSTEAGRVALERQIGHLVGAIGGSVPPSTLRCPVIPLGVDEEYFNLPDRAQARRHWGVNEREIALVAVGRLSSRTKADLRPLLVAFSQLRDRCHASVRLFLAGDDPEQETRALLAVCEALRIAPLVTIVPRINQTEKLRLLAAADVFVAPSDNVQETFGLAVVEAMAAGLPVVASDWSGMRETVVHDETGFLVPTAMPHYDERLAALGGVGGTLADHLTAQTTILDLPSLVGALHRLVEHQSLRRRFGDLGRQRAERLYHIARVVGRHEGLWAELLAEPPRSIRGLDASTLFSYQCATIFEHYATGALSGEERVTLTELGARCLDERGHALLVSLGGSARLFRPADLLSVLRSAREAGTISIGQLASTARRPDDRLTLFAAAARLLKVGALSFLRHT